jgi:hypothetical protein
MYPDTSKYRDPADFHFEPLEEAENQEPDAVAATGVVASKPSSRLYRARLTYVMVFSAYYSYDYIHPVYSSAAESRLFNTL